MATVPVATVRPPARRLAPALVVGLCLALAGGAAIAAPGEVENVRLDDPSNIRWDLLAGSKGYNVYVATLPRLQSGDYGDCHVGSHRTTSLTDLDIPSSQPLLIFWVTGLDESGEGTAGPGPAGGRRAFGAPCIPSRRNFDFTVNGDTGDGVLDGAEPARNPSIDFYPTSRELTGVYLHSGEFTVTAIDSLAAQRGSISRGDAGAPGVGSFGQIFTPSVTQTVTSAIETGRSGSSRVRGKAVTSLTGKRQHGPVRISKQVDVANALNVGASTGQGTGLDPSRPGLDPNAIGLDGEGTSPDPSAGRSIPGGWDWRGLPAIPGESIPVGDFHCPSMETCYYYRQKHKCDLYDQCIDAYRKCPEEERRRDATDWWKYWHIGDVPEKLDVTPEHCFPAMVLIPPPVVPAAKVGGAEFSSLQRRYGSQILYDGPLGHGWEHAANERIAMAMGDIIVNDGMGRADLFLRDTLATFISPAGVYAILIENPDGSYTKRDPGGTLHNFHPFDGSNREGALESVEDRNGNFASFLYDHQGLLTTVVDTMGRSTDLEYDAAGRITAITDFAARRVEYGYDGNGDLVLVRSPVVTGTPNGNDFPAGKVTTYQYSSGFADPRLNHNLTGIIRPNDGPGGTPVIQMTYGQTPGADDFDRVTTQMIGGDEQGVMEGGQNSYTHQLVNRGAPPDTATPRRRVTVIDRNGNGSIYEHNWAGNLLSRTDLTNRDLRPGEPDYTTTHSYSPEGERLETILAEGNRVQFSYDSASPNRGSQGNLLELRIVPDNPGAVPGRGDGHGGSLADRIWTFTWDDYFNGPLSMTGPRGNDPAYVPQNGGAQSAARDTTTWIYDHQEGDPATNGVDDLGTRFGIVPCVTPLDLGEVNGDGVTDQAGGNVIRSELPAVRLDPLSHQAAIEGDTSQEIVTQIRRNGFGQPTQVVDPEGNVHLYEYFPENDPDGDGVGSSTPDDSRPLDSLTGGYLKTARFDTMAGAGRDNGTDPTPADIQVDFQYDAVGNVTGVVDGRGVLTRFTVNALNQVVQVTRASATADAAVAGASPTGRGETGLSPEGFLTRFHYDANDNLVKTEDEDRGATRGVGPFIATDRTYDLLDRLRTVAQETAPGVTLVTQFDYDANGNLTRVTQPEGNAHQFLYDERDLLLTRTLGASGPRGGTPSVHTYAYDGNGNLTRYNDALGEQVDYAYDGFDRIARTTDRVGDTADRYYDPAGQVVRSLLRGPVGGPTPPDRAGSVNENLAESFFLYDELGRLFRRDRALFVPAGVTPALTPILSEGPIAPGDPRIDSSDGLVTRLYEHDRLSRRSFSVRDSGATTRHDYDGAGRLVKTTMPLGAGSREFTYDGASNLVEAVETESPTGGAAGLPAETFLTTAFFDALGRWTMTVDNLGQTSRLVYDSLGAVTAVTDPRGPLTGSAILRRSPGHTTESVDINEHGNVTRFTYDGAGRRLTTVQVLTPSGEGDGTLGPTPDDSNVFNPDGLITSTTVWDGNSLPGSYVDDRGNTTTFTFDNLDRLGSSTPDDGTETRWSYDAQGNLTSVVEANGSEIANGYDAAHRLILVDITPAGGAAGTTRQTLEYDGLGRVTRASDNNDPAATADDVTTTMLYDSLSRRFEEGQQIGGGAGASVLSTGLGWLAEDLQSDRIYPGGRHISYGYDGAERLVSVDDLDPAAGQAGSYEYFGLDRIHTLQRANGPSATMLNPAGDADVGYDGRKRITLLQHLDPGSGGVSAAFEQMYDRAGHPTSQRRPHHIDATGEARTETFQWDSAGRLIAFAEGFAGIDHVLAGTPDDGKTWQLDGTGIWPVMSRNGIDYGATPNNRNLYDENWSGGSTPDDGVPDDFLDDLDTPIADGLNFAHDENGNRTFDGRHTLTYDALNRLIVAIRASDDALVGSYTYDAFGRRVTYSAESAPGVTMNRRYLYAGAAVIEERDPGAGAIVRQIVYGAGGPLWQRLGSGLPHYYLEDPAGSVAALFFAGATGGAVVERVTYDPYGKPQFESAANVPLTDAAGDFVAASGFGNTLLWSGLWYDPELGDRSDDVNTDWGGIYLGINDAMGVEPVPFRDANAEMGVDPTPFLDINAVMGVEPIPFRAPGAGIISDPPPNPWRPAGVQPGPFRFDPPPNPWRPAGARPGPFRVYDPNTAQSMNMDSLQTVARQQHEFLNLLHAIMKTLRSTAKAIINNMKG